MATLDLTRAVADGPAPLPRPRGPLSAHLLEHLARPPHEVPAGPEPADDPLGGDDAQLALYCCYELHYRPMAGVDEAWEWEPSLLSFRGRLERAFEERLREEAGELPPADDVVAGLERIAEDDAGPSLSAYAEKLATLEQLREFAVHRSAYQLKEADPHTWGIPRLSGAAKAALIDIQSDEYGGGVEEEMHATLFAATMRELGLDATYGAYLDLLPGTTLATTNVVSLFGLHRRLRGALVGHLALFEMTSVVPMGRYGRALDRLGVGPVARRFYDVHVEADAGHSVVGSSAMAGGLAAAEPDLSADVLFGAKALALVEDRFAHCLLGAWADGRTSLLAPPAPSAA